MFPLAFVASCYLIEKVFAMRRTKWFLGLCAAALAGSLSFSGSVLAQTQVIPDDVLNPKADSNIPELLQGIKSKIRLEDIGIVDQLRFDSLLDPSNGVGSTRSAAAQSIIHNHQLAQQQVQLAITFLQANRNDIIRGRNKAFNDVFGKVGTLKRVAVLAPVSLPGQFNLVSPTLLRDSGAQGGNNNTPTIGSVGTQLRSGDSLFLIDPADPQNQNITTNNNTTNTFTPRAVPNQQNVGYVVKVAGVILPQTGGANGEMRIYVNGSVVETRTHTSSGTYSGLVATDTIYVEIELLGACSGFDNKGNVYTTSNRATLVDADCFT